MEEIIKIESENGYVKKYKRVMIIAILVTIVSLIIGIVCGVISENLIEKAKQDIWDAIENNDDEEYIITSSGLKMFGSKVFYTILRIELFITFLSGSTSVICMFVVFCAGSMKIVVTDKRIYGKTYFGRQVDLPLDSVSAIGKGIFNSIAISTSSGKISFLGISNRNDIYKVISELLITRQNSNQVTNSNANTNNNTNNTSNISIAEEIKKYKELLDIGAITEEEYNAKKKELLG